MSNGSDTHVPDKGASLDQNASEASDARAASVRGIMARNREHGEEGTASATEQRLAGLSDLELLHEWKTSEPGSELHDLIADELESRSVDS